MSHMSTSRESVGLGLEVGWRSNWWDVSNIHWNRPRGKVLRAPSRAHLLWRPRAAICFWCSNHLIARERDGEFGGGVGQWFSQSEVGERRLEDHQKSHEHKSYRRWCCQLRWVTDWSRARTRGFSGRHSHRRHSQRCLRSAAHIFPWDGSNEWFGWWWAYEKCRG